MAKRKDSRLRLMTRADVGALQLERQRVGPPVPVGGARWHPPGARLMPGMCALHPTGKGCRCEW